MAPTQVDEQHEQPGNSIKFVPTIYRSPLGKRRLSKHYTETLAALPFPVEERMVSTHWGKAHVLVAGPIYGIPFFIWQGTAAPGPYMLSLFISLVPKYRVYVADVPCQAGSRSEPARFDPEKNELGQWSAQVIIGSLGQEESNANQSGGDISTTAGNINKNSVTSKHLLHAGISFGGGVIIDLARVHPSLISAAVLIVPSSLHPECSTYGYFFEVTRKVFLPMMAYRWLPCKITKHRVFDSMFDEPDLDHPVMKQQELAFKHVLWFPRPAKHVESKTELENYKNTPTLLFTAEQDVFGGGEATSARAREIFDSSCELVVEELKGTKHVPSTEKMIHIMHRIEEFFAEKGFSGVNNSGQTLQEENFASK